MLCFWNVVLALFALTTRSASSMESTCADQMTCKDADAVRSVAMLQVRTAPAKQENYATSLTKAKAWLSLVSKEKASNRDDCIPTSLKEVRLMQWKSHADHVARYDPEPEPEPNSAEAAKAAADAKAYDDAMAAEMTKWAAKAAADAKAQADAEEAARKAASKAYNDAMAADAKAQADRMQAQRDAENAKAEADWKADEQDRYAAMAADMAKQIAEGWKPTAADMEMYRYYMEMSGQTMAGTLLLSQDAPAGTKVLPTSGNTGFQVGEDIVIDAGAAIEEFNRVVGYGSLILENPLKFDHGTGATIGHAPAASTGSTAPLDAAGFLAVTNLCCPIEMELFFNRLLASKGLVVCSKPHIQGLMHWFHCVPAMDFQYVLDVMDNGNPCKFWALPNSCPVLSAQCQGQWCR